MRVVVDCRFIADDNIASAVVSHVLRSWHEAEAWDEIHVLVMPHLEIDVPDHVSLHRLSFPSSVVGRQVFRRRVARFCRAIDADVLLTIAPPQDGVHYRLPHVVLVHALPVARRARGFRTVDATVCLSERIKHEVLSYTPELIDRPVWIIAPPASTSLEPAVARYMAVNETREAELAPQLTVVNDALAVELGQELSAWSEVSGRLRLVLVDAMARASWRSRRFSLHRPIASDDSVVVPLPSGERSGTSRRVVGHRHVSISGRAVVGGALGALALSAVSAASVVIATAPTTPAPPHHVVAPATTATTSGPATPGSSGVTSANATPTITPPSSSSSSSSAATTTTLPNIVLPSTTESPTVTAPTLPTSGLPTVTVPSITIPSLPITLCPSSSSTTTTTTSGFTGLSIPSLCNLSVTAPIVLKTP